MSRRIAATCEELAARVERALAEAPELDVRDLNVSAVDGVVRLSGACPTLRQVRLAAELAAVTLGVHALDNMLTVECPRPVTDDDLRTRAQTAAAAIDSRVDVEVEDGVAILRGEVEGPDTVDAVIAAVERVPGLKELRCELTFPSLTGGEQRLLPALEQAIRAAYPVLGAVRVRDARHGRVTLEGRVSSSEQRDRVLESVRRVPGVRHVESYIRIRPNKPEAVQGRHRSGAGW